MKKVLSLVLVIAMVLSSMSFAFAGTFEDVTGDYEKAISTLAGLGVVTGYEDGTYRPEKVVTRAEMAKLIVEILGYGDLVAGSKSNFSDTQGHWADPWIALAAGKGLVVGTGDGKFTPDRTVSYDEAITMVVRALGYTDSSNELKGMTWPTNFKVKAAELKLTKDVKLASTGADRGGVAQLLYNALEAVLVTVNSDGDVVKNVDKNGDYVQLLSRLATLDETTYRPVQPKHIDADDKAYAGDIVDLAPYMYQNLTVYVNDDDEVVYVKSTEDLVVTGVIDEAADINKTNDTVRIEDANGDEYTFKVDANTELMINGVETSFDDADKTLTALAYSGEGPYIKVTLVLDADDDAKLKSGYTVDGIVTEIATAEVRVANDYVTGRTRINTIALPKDSDGDVEVDKITVIGDASKLEDIKEDAIVTAYAGKDADGNLEKIKLAVSYDTVEGEISKTNYDLTTVTIDGKAYDASAFYDLSDIEAGNEGTLFLNAEGYFHEFELESEKEAKDYAVVVGVQNGVYSSTLKANEKDAKIRLATKDDEEIVYVVADEAELNGKIVDNTESGSEYIGVEEVSTKVAVDTVVEYSLDEDGNIEYIKNVVFDDLSASFDPDSKAFILASNAVIFDGYTADKYQVLSASQLDEDGITAKVVYNKDGEIELLVVLSGVQATSGTYAVINNVEKTTNTSGKIVYLVTAYVDGTKVTYLTSRTFYTDNSDATVLRSAVRGGFKLNELTMDGDVITGIRTITTSTAIAAERYVEGNVTSVKVANDVVKVIDAAGNEKVITLADEAVIYLQTGTATVEVTDISDIDADATATKDSTEGDIVKAIDTDDDGEYDILIIKER